MSDLLQEANDKLGAVVSQLTIATEQLNATLQRQATIDDVIESMLLDAKQQADEIIKNATNTRGG